MSSICDVCKTAVPVDARFCPNCGLEIVSRRDRTSRPPPMEKDVFDWDETPGHSTEYDVAKNQTTGLSAERAMELIKLAETRFGEGHVIEASGLIKQVKAQSTGAKVQVALERIIKKIAARKRSIRQRCTELTDARDATRLVAYLAGQASNELEQEEVCAVALEAARKLFQSAHADGAWELLRLAPFRTLREQGLVQTHRELELQVHRVRARQHAVKSFLLIGGIIVAASIGLSLFAMTLWHGGTRALLWIILALGLGAVALIAAIPQLRVWFLSEVSRSTSRSRTAEKLASFLKERRK